MSRLAYEDLEVVGFDGTVLVECEAVLPVVRVKDSDLFFLLEAVHTDPSGIEGIESESVEFSSKSEIETLASMGRLTLLREPLPAFANAVVAYVNREFLLLADAKPEDSVYWQMLSDDVLVMLGPEKVIEGILDGWAGRIMDNATLLLERFLAIEDLAGEDRQLCAQAEHLTDLAICAASNRTLRARIYLRAGLAIMFSQTPERLDNYFRISVRLEFKDWSWDGFQARLRGLADILKLRAKYFLSDSVGEAEKVVDPFLSTAQSAPTDPSFELNQLLALSAKVAEIVDEDQRYPECENVARDYQKRTEIPDVFYQLAAEYISRYSEAPLVDEIIKPLKADPLIYYLLSVWYERAGSDSFNAICITNGEVTDNVLVSVRRDGRSLTKPKLNCLAYLEGAKALKLRGEKLGDLAEKALAIAEESRKDVGEAVSVSTFI